MEHVHAYTDIDSTTNINHFLSLFFSLGSSVNRREKERGNPLSNRIRAGNRIYIYIYIPIYALYTRLNRPKD